MDKRKILALFAVALLTLVPLVAGCGGDDAQTKDTPAAEQAIPEQNAEPAATPTETAAVHDCDGGCGMKDVPVDQLTEIDGKFYCAGCAKKMKGDDQSGHG